MIEIKLIDESFAHLNATHQEYLHLVILMEHAKENYNNTDLDYHIPGIPEHRLASLRICLNAFTDETLPLILSERDLHVLKVVTQEFQEVAIEGLTANQIDHLYNQFDRYDFKNMFGWRFE